MQNYELHFAYRLFLDLPLSTLFFVFVPLIFLIGVRSKLFCILGLTFGFLLRFALMDVTFHSINNIRLAAMQQDELPEPGEIHHWSGAGFMLTNHFVYLAYFKEDDDAELFREIKRNPSTSFLAHPSCHLHTSRLTPNFVLIESTCG